MRTLVADPNLTDKNTYHTYLEPYQELLVAYADDSQGILEIGAWQGGSLLMWRNYFRPGIKVVGVDVTERPLKLQGQAIGYLQGNAYDLATLTALKTQHGLFSVIIDDGSHVLEDVKFVCVHYRDLLVPGGLLVIEDIQDPIWLPELAALFPGWQTGIRDVRSKKLRYDDLLFCVWKPVATLAGNVDAIVPG